MNLVQVLEAVTFTGTCARIPERIFDLVSMIITVLKFGIPVLLIIFGMLDLGKAVVASKEDEIKKGQQMFIKRLISAIIVFFVVVVVQLVVNVAAGNESSSIWNCVNGFIKGVEKCSGEGEGAICTVKS
jgi:D-alanyl-lipoteichoic acid acyltransferase DltB (MBOAT superfamily)